MPNFVPFDLMPTPNPDEEVVVVTVETHLIKQRAQLPVAGVTEYKDFQLSPREFLGDYGQYVFVKKSKPGAGLLSFHFSAPKTEAQKYTPWRTEPRGEKDMFWPNVMERWRAEPDPTRALERRDPTGVTIYDMQWKAVYVLKPYYQGPTRIERYYYLSPTKFTLKNVRGMQTVSFGWALPGDSMDPARMLLARRFHVPTRIIGPTSFSHITYDPTYPPGWVRHLHDTDQEQLDSGIWSMWEDYAIPPAQLNRVREK